jgi:hypothetical protein
MDALSDLLRVVRLDGAFFYTVEGAEPWSVQALPARELSPRIMPHTEHLISYHILTEGHCYAGPLGEEQVELSAGDVIVFPHGDAHVCQQPGLRVAWICTAWLHPSIPARSASAGPRTSHCLRVPGLRYPAVQSPARRPSPVPPYAASRVPRSAFTAASRMAGLGRAGADACSPVLPK